MLRFHPAFFYIDSGTETDAITGESPVTAIPVWLRVITLTYAGHPPCSEVNKKNKTYTARVDVQIRRFRSDAADLRI